VLHGVVYSDGVLVHSAPNVTVVLLDSHLWGGFMVNPGFCGQRGGSCACSEMASSVVLTGVHVWSSFVRRFEDAPMLVRGSC
jgi:hypothetical protein